MAFARLVLVLSALPFLGIGLAFLADPAGMGARVGVALEGATAQGDVRAVYGGLQLGVGAFLLLAARRAAWVRAGLAAQLLAYGGLAAARLASWALDGRPDALGLALHAGEALGLAFGAAAWARLRH